MSRTADAGSFQTDGAHSALRYPAGTLASSRAEPAGWLAGILYLTILGSPLVFIEPSPYEGLALILAMSVLVAGSVFHGRLLPFLILLVLWIVGGVMATMPVFHHTDSITYLAITIYLCFSSFIFALLFSEDVMRRLAALRAAYIFAATLTALAGSAAYFGLIPGSELLMEFGRVRGTFEDPNVFGPYLILPMLFIIQSFLRGRIRISYVLAILVLLVGLLLSGSRGAWGHFVFSTGLMTLLMFMTEPSRKERKKLVVGVSAAGMAVAALVVALVSVPAVQDLLEQRASLVQEYDAGPAGRFTAQITALDNIIEHPNGMGPREFGRELLRTQAYGADPHDVYINALLSYGWLGGFSYIALVLITLQQGFVALTKRTPWQPFLIAIYATFAGVAAEGFIIDTDHWRHWFLLLGAIWGLVVATLRYDAGREELRAA